MVMFTLLVNKKRNGKTCLLQNRFSDKPISAVGGTLLQTLFVLSIFRGLWSLVGDL